MSPLCVQPWVFILQFNQRTPVNNAKEGEGFQLLRSHKKYALNHTIRSEEKQDTGGTQDPSQQKEMEIPKPSASSSLAP